MRLRFLAPLVLFALGTGCSSPSRATPTRKRPTPSPEVQALRSARSLLDDSNPQDALAALDVALALRGPKKQAEVQFLRGVAMLQMGTEAKNALFFEDARQAFMAAKDLRPAALFGAARATWMLSFASSDPQVIGQALTLVRQGFELRSDSREDEHYYNFSPERTHGEIAFSAYTASKNQALPAARSTMLFNEALDALEAEIGNDPTNSWGWSQIANLYLWEGRLADARATIAGALNLNPESAELHASYLKLAEQDGGWEEAVKAYLLFVKEHDSSAISHWYLAKAYYEFALEALLANSDDRSVEFFAAAEHFRRSRELEPSYTDSTRGFEIICRNGLGWSHYYAGRLAEAAKAWWSMEDFVEGGLQWEIPGRMFSGLDSLAFAINAHNAKWEEGRDSGTMEGYDAGFPHLVRAANLSNRAFEYKPEDWSRANNAGYFSRDLAVQLQNRGTIALGMKVERAEQLFAQSNEYMEKSLKAYEVAVRLAPTDARTINDTGLILAYYLQRDLDRAEQFFRDALRVGLLQLKTLGDNSEERGGVTAAVGDAYQNLGVLELTLRGNAAAALPFFERSLSYEVEKRVEVRQSLIPLCNKVIAGEIQPELVMQAHSWGQLNAANVAARQAAKAKLSAVLAKN